MRYHVKTEQDTEPETAMQEKPGLEETVELMKDLRRRCEWDAAQTHESLRPYLLEEAYEVDDAIRSGNDTLLREELGDLLLQVLFHSVVAEERGAFDFGDVAEGFLRKMKSRHPHLYEGGVHGAEPVAVGLHHREERHAGTRRNGSPVTAQRGQVHLHPGACHRTARCAIM